MKVLGIDVETTGLDTASEYIIEVGAVVFDVNADHLWAAIDGASHLVHEPSYPVLSELIEGLTGITDPILRLEGIPFENAMFAIDKMCKEQSPQFVIAHNRSFDQAIIASQLDRWKLKYDFMSLPWLCSIMDLETNVTKTCKRLSHLALDYGVVVDPNVLHRATDDVALMGRMLSAAKADPRAMHIYAMTPEVSCVALVPGPWVDGGKGTNAAKAAGYRFVPDSKKWVKVVKETALEPEMNRLFKVEVIK